MKVNQENSKRTVLGHGRCYDLWRNSDAKQNKKKVKHGSYLKKQNSTAELQITVGHRPMSGEILTLVGHYVRTNFLTK